jgi:ABC-type multidrug transport system ATPase subunit
MRLMHGTLGAGEGGGLSGSSRGSMTVDGSVRIDSQWVAHACEHGVMYAAQHSFIPVGRLVGRVLSDYGVKFESLVASFPIFGGYRHHPVAALSGGERRILQVFVVLTSPMARFCLLDEPFSQVSPLHAGVLKTLIVDAARGGKGILISDHLYRDICKVSDDIYIIAGGTTRLLASPDDLHKFGYVKTKDP